jgi:hypothetical protein
MRRWPAILAMLVVAAAAAACGGTLPDAGSEAAPPAAGAPAGETGFATETSGFSETSGTEAATTGTPEPPPAPELKPPPIVLKSEAGRQEAVFGSYCITSMSSSGGEGAGICTDSTFPHPKELTVTRPGESIRITIVGTHLVVPAGCAPASGCASAVTIYPLGCGPERAVANFELSRDTTHWNVDLEPGAYELSVFAYFDDGAGTSGDVSGALGLLVDPDRGAAIVPMDESLLVCPYPEQP